MDIQFKTVTIECEENYPKAINPRDVAAYLSKKKSMSYSDLNKDELLITADTVVIIQNEILKSAELTGSWEKQLKDIEKEDYSTIENFPNLNESLYYRWDNLIHIDLVLYIGGKIENFC